MKLKPLTPSELNEAIARIAEEFYGRSHVSPVELVRASGYLEGRASVTVEAVEAALAAHPSWVTAWLTYSADKRTRSERMQDRAVGELNLSERTAHHMRTVLGTALALALRDGLVMRNVASLARPRPVPHSERTVLNPDEVAALVAGLRGDRLEALFVLAVASGLRQGELLGLRWKDVDLTDGILRVSGALQRVSGSLVRVEPKTPQSRRTIGLPPNVVEVLRAHKARQNAERLRAGEAWHDGDYVFARTDGQPIYGEYVTWQWHNLRSRLGLPAVSFHDLRHTAASLMLAMGVDLRVIQTTLGHSAIRTTAETYTHVLPALQRDAANRMDALFEQARR